jgi:hypothetical protein
VTHRLTSIAIAPANPSIQLHQQQILTATGTFDDGSVQNITDAVSWSLSGAGAFAGVAEIGQTGWVVGTAVGTVTLQAYDPGSGVIAKTTLTVTPAAAEAMRPPSAVAR